MLTVIIALCATFLAIGLWVGAVLIDLGKTSAENWLRALIFAALAIAVFFWGGWVFTR
jgi:hypothetical protein